MRKGECALSADSYPKELQRPGLTHVKVRAGPREGQGWPTWRSGVAHAKAGAGPHEVEGWRTRRSGA